METLDYLKNFYENYDEDSRFSSKHGMVEYLTTMRYIEKYISQNSRIIEIGAATGRYSHALAQKGYRVDAVELIEHNIEIFKRNTKEGENISIVQGNALDLSDFEDNTYDITLLLGPMYHLFTKEDQQKALSEAVRVTKKGGMIFTAYCGNDATIVKFCFGKGMINIEPYKSSLIDPVTFKADSTPEEIFALNRKEDIEALTKSLPVSRIKFIGTDMAAGYISDTVDGMDEETFSSFLNYHFYICERQDMVGVSTHFLDILEKIK
ncbi:MAG: class I SAM-dependent methyltransferase [Ruminococcaceae bacterium]|nr:class I SAM-dependent methyltransferase [Oscillospiraceae bacterium]